MKRVICVILLCILLCGCSAEQKTQRDVWAMDTYMNLQVWGGDSETAAEQIADMIQELEQTWSASNDDSLIYHILTAGEEETALLERVQALSDRTRGAFNPKMGAVSQAWGFLSKQYRVPTQEELEQALAKEQWDLGAALKGYAGDRAVEILQQLDVESALINLGGNVQTYGEKSDGTPWKIGIQNPEGEDALGIIAVEGTASVVTSGNYQRYFEQDGIRYHHILDPKTGKPADSGLSSVTVICRDGLTADALSTALFVMGLEEGTQFWRESDDFEAVFLLADGRIYATEGVNLSGCKYEVICREN